MRSVCGCTTVWRPQLERLSMWAWCCAHPPVSGCSSLTLMAKRMASASVFGVLCCMSSKALSTFSGAMPSAQLLGAGTCGRGITKGDVCTHLHASMCQEAMLQLQEDFGRGAAQHTSLTSRLTWGLWHTLMNTLRWSVSAVLMTYLHSNRSLLRDYCGKAGYTGGAHQ